MEDLLDPTVNRAAGVLGATLNSSEWVGRGADRLGSFASILPCPTPRPLSTTPDTAPSDGEQTRRESLEPAV